jgi:hypothetical protein
MDKPKRKPRSDRSHVIYRITNTITGDTYIGLTVCAGKSPKRAVDARWVRHVGRALLHDKSWKLCESIRKHGEKSFTREVLEVVRGKAAAHQRERALTKELGATLNTA